MIEESKQYAVNQLMLMGNELKSGWNSREDDEKDQKQFHQQGAGETAACKKYRWKMSLTIVTEGVRCEKERSLNTHNSKELQSSHIISPIQFTNHFYCLQQKRLKFFNTNSTDESETEFREIPLT